MLKHCRRLLVPFLLISGCATLRAQFCFEIKPPKVALKEASAVFLGTIDSIECKYRRTEELCFTVQEVFKGPRLKQIVVETGMSDSGGASPFRVGKQYLVFAYAKYGEIMLGAQRRVYGTSMCSGSKLASSAAADIEYVRNITAASVEGVTAHRNTEQNAATKPRTKTK